MKSVAFIDCFIETPAVNCVNNFILASGIPCTYHMISKYGAKTLERLPRADGYIILGSASHVQENLPWHKDLLDFIIPKIEQNIPTLGICFGHQLIAKYYGCEVDYISEDQKIRTEVREIEFIENSLNFTQGEKLNLAYSHAQVVTKLDTNSFIATAKSDVNRYEALKHTKYKYWSFQAHPEASIYFLKEDAKIDRPSLIEKTLADGYSVLKAFSQTL